MTLFEGNRPLLDAFRRGDSQALRTVYLHYFDVVYAQLRAGFPTGQGGRVGGLNDADALDALQEVFVRAFSDNARLAYDGLRPYRPYLLRIARNLRVDLSRRSGRELAVPDIDDARGAIAMGEPPPPEPSTGFAELREAARAYIDTLDSEARAYVDARFAEEQSQLEVASQLGVTRRRVRTLEERVERGFRRFLHKRGIRFP